jgi:hypothetical protein
MKTRLTLLLAIAAMLSMSVSGFASDFWGITVGTATYDGASQLTFSGVGSNVQYVPGCYQYTEVNSTWYGPFAASSPGPGYTAAAKCGADGLFFQSDGTNAEFVVVTGDPQSGFTAPELGYGSRQFGPGDLKIDIGSNTYGLGMRASNLAWNFGPTSEPEYQITEAGSGITDSLNARNAGTAGTVALNPQWDHVDNASLPPTSGAAYAFFVSGTGTKVGTDTVNIVDTGVTLNGADIYAYEVTVPLATLGLTGSTYSFNASWRPDCGNGLITGSFSGTNTVGYPTVPEPMSMLLAALGMTGIAFRKVRSLV